MSILRKFEPRKRMIDVNRTAPFTQGWDDFLEDFPPRRWMESFEPFGFKWPMGVDFERSFRIDVVDRDEELLVRAELPGVEKDAVEVTLIGDRLMIEAEREFEDKEEKEAFYRHEVGFGKLVRTVALPVDIDIENVRAELKDGILEILLPKMHAAERFTVKVA